MFTSTIRSKDSPENRSHQNKEKDRERDEERLSHKRTGQQDNEFKERERRHKREIDPIEQQDEYVSSENQAGTEYSSIDTEQLEQMLATKHANAMEITSESMDFQSHLQGDIQQDPTRLEEHKEGSPVPRQPEEHDILEEEEQTNNSAATQEILSDKEMVVIAQNVSEYSSLSLEERFAKMGDFLSDVKNEVYVIGIDRPLSQNWPTLYLLDTMSEMTLLFQDSRTLNSHAAFNNITSHLLLSIREVSAQRLWPQVLKRLKYNEDLEMQGYINFLLERQETSFAISKFPPQSEKTYDLSNRINDASLLSLFRLNCLKVRIAMVLCHIYEAMQIKMVYYAHIEYPSYEVPSAQPKVQYLSTLNGEVPNKKRIVQVSKEGCKRFFELHKVIEDDFNVISTPIASQFHYYVYDVMEDGKHGNLATTQSINLSRGLCGNLHSPNIGYLWNEQLQQSGVIQIKEGQLIIKFPFDIKNDLVKEAKSITSLNLLLKECKLEGFFLQKMSVNGYLKPTSFKGINHLSTDIKTQSTFLLDPTTTTSSAEQVKDDIKVLQVDKPLYFPRKKLEGGSRNTKGQFDIRMNTVSLMTFVRHEYAETVLSSFFKTGGKFNTEVQLSFQDLLPQDTWSLYYRWEALSNDPLTLSFSVMASYIRSLASKSLWQTIQTLQADKDIKESVDMLLDLYNVKSLLSDK